jgi:hypothetical protein
LRWNIHATLPEPARWPWFLGEDGADFGGGAVLVVGGRFEQDGDAAGAVALVGHFLVGRAFEFAGALLDGALDVVDRHAFAAGGGDGLAQAGIEMGSPPPILAATEISLESLLKILPRFWSMAPL